MGTIELLSQAVDSIVDTKLAAYKAAIVQLVNPNFNLFNLVQIAGSEAKKHYGFTLHEANTKHVRDLDVVLRSKDIDTTIFEILQESSDKIITGYTGDMSSCPIYFTGEQKFKTALYSFAYPYKGEMRWVEVFAAQSNTPQQVEFVPLKQLIECASEWKREKDYFFLKQVFALTAGIELPETVASKAYDEFLDIKGEDVNGYSKPTTFNLNKLSNLMKVDRSKLQEALQEAHGNPEWICVATKILTIGEVKYLKKVFENYPREVSLYQFIHEGELNTLTQWFNKL